MTTYGSGIYGAGPYGGSMTVTPVRYGTKPAVTFADPEAEVVDILTAAWVTRTDPYKPTRISTHYPNDPLDGNDTRIQVDLELGNAADYPVTERAQVRVVCHAPRGKRSNVKQLASTTEAILYSHPGSSTVAGITIATGRSGVSTDPDTQNLMVWLLVRVNLKATPLAP